MIVVRLEVWPRGREAAKTELGLVKIENDLTGTTALGNYIYTFLRKPAEAIHPRVWIQGRVEGFPRAPAVTTSPWQLLRGVLDHALGASVWP